MIDDNVDAADSLKQLLLLENHLVEVAYRGAEGVERARSFHPDVVFCDIGLPEMDGYQVARAIRADPELGSPVLIALTGYAQPEDRMRAREAGFDHHVPKPPSLELLQDLLSERRAPAP